MLPSFLVEDHLHSWGILCAKGVQFSETPALKPTLGVKCIRPKLQFVVVFSFHLGDACWYMTICTGVFKVAVEWLANNWYSFNYLRIFRTDCCRLQA